MRALVQRVSEAHVVVAGETVGAIGPGLCALIGVTHDDGEVQADKLADKLVNLRIFDDDAGVMNRSLLDTAGELLVVSQFTLYGDARKGRRPSYVAAARPDHAEPLVDRVVDQVRRAGLGVATGRFRTEMAVSLTNDGPVTLLVEV